MENTDHFGTREEMIDRYLTAVQERDAALQQLSAARMHTARLHMALQNVVVLNGTGGDKLLAALAAAKQVLEEHSEPMAVCQIAAVDKLLKEYRNQDRDESLYDADVRGALKALDIMWGGTT